MYSTLSRNFQAHLMDMNLYGNVNLMSSLWPPFWSTAGLYVVNAWIEWFLEDVTVFERVDN